MRQECCPIRAAIPVAVVVLAIAATALAGCKKEQEGKRWYGHLITPDGRVIVEEISDEPFGDVEVVDVPEEPLSSITSQEVVVVPDAENGDGDFLQQFYLPPLQQDDGIFISFGDECLVQNAQLVHGGQADDPLRFPLNLTSPAPGAANRKQTGPVDGPVQGANPARRISGSAFEYHSTLNGIHGCTSRQVKSSLMTMIVARNKAVLQATFESPRPDDDALYQGNTRTGQRAALGGVVYEGTEQKIHWLDTPSVETTVTGAARRLVQARLLLLRSITYDGNGTTGRMCISGHSMVWYPTDGTLLTPKAAQTLLAGVQPALGNQAPQNLKDAARVLSTPEAKGGHEGKKNPEFRDLGCYPF